MVLVLNAQNNGLYGGNLINQKYSPLANIILGGGVPAEYRNLFTTRIDQLRNNNIYPPNTLNLYANWNVVNGAVNVNQAPMVVISSSRAEWMARILQNAVDHGPFDGYTDPGTFDDGVVPWYAPGRSGRPVYVVVHWSEYQYYADRLAAIPLVTVVGFQFTAAAPMLDMVGFGVSRYAALQLVIHLGYHRAWAVDDNVVNINGFPQTLAPVEADMPAQPVFWGIGFRAASANINLAGLYDGEVTFAPVQYNFGTMGPGILQQVVLWNIDQFRQGNLNFSPIFVSSNEDISLSNFLQATNRAERVITSLRIVKYEPVKDSNLNVGGTVQVPRRRNRMLGFFDQIEDSIPINPGGGQVRLFRFIVDTVLPNAQQPRPAALWAQSQAVEQVMAAAITTGAAWYPADAFNPYSGAPNGAPIVQPLNPDTLPPPSRRV